MINMRENHTLTFDGKVFKSFKEFCYARSMKMSQKLEAMMKETMKHGNKN